MAKRAITDEVYNSLLNEFRLDPSHPYTVAKKAGVAPRTAMRAWELGWPGKGFPPIKETIEAEQQKARAMAMAHHAARKATSQKERDDAIEHAAKVRLEEGQIVRLVRGSSLQALTVAVGLTGSARKLTKQLTDKIDALASLPAGDPAQLTTNQGLHMLKQIADLNRSINICAREALELERLHMGEPTSTVAVQTTEMTITDADSRIAAAQQALQKAKEIGGFTVIDGGQSAPVIGKRVTS